MKKVLWALLAVFVIIQFIRPAGNSSSAVSDNDISRHYPVSAEVKTVLAKACNDCHSNNTIYPWYYYVQPVSWWLNNHILEGKQHLNFSEFTAYRPWRQFHKMEEVQEVLKEGEMPLESYTVAHKDAILTAEEKQTLYNWSEMVKDSMRRQYPADSLVRPAKKG